MLIWSGLGIVAALMPVAGYGLVAKIVSLVFGTDYILHHSWPGALGTLVGAAGVWIMSKKVADPSRHAFFFVPIEYLGPVFAVVAILMLLIKTDSAI